MIIWVTLCIHTHETKKVGKWDHPAAIMADPSKQPHDAEFPCSL